MRARRRRSHQPARPVDARAQDDALGSRARAGAAPRRRLRRRSARALPSRPRKDGLRVARRLRREPAAVLEGDAACRGELVEPRLPRAALLGRHVPHPEERLVDLLGVRRAAATLLPGHARSPRGRGCRSRPPSAGRGRAASRRPACAAPRGARRRGTCRAARRGCRARTRRARPCPRRAARSTRPSGRAGPPGSPSTSIASVRQSSIVWATIGWSIGTSTGRPAASRGRR